MDKSKNRGQSKSFLARGHKPMNGPLLENGKAKTNKQTTKSPDSSLKPLKETRPY